jgi:hypothetical protein
MKCCVCGKQLKRGQYRVLDDEKYCFDCYRAGAHKNKPDSLIPDVLPPAKKENPYLARAKMKPMEEIAQKVVLEGKVETLTEVTRQFEQLREIAAAMAKKNDIYHVSRIDMYLQEVLDIITSEDALAGLQRNIVDKMLAGDLREVRALIQTVKDLVECKDLLAQSFDDGRGVGGQKKHMKLQLAFKNADGSMVAAKAEV